MGKTPVLGVDLGEHSAKYVLLSAARKDIVIEQFGVVDLKDVGKIRAALAAKGAKSFRTIAGISGQSVFLRFVRLPPVPKRQMDQIVRYEAQQQVPFPIEDVRWDYQTLNAASSDERDVVLVAVKNEIVQDVVKSLGQAGLQPEVLDASVLALVNGLLASQIIHPGNSSMILDIGAKTTHMILADRGGLWARNIPIAGNHITQAIAEELGVGHEEAERLKLLGQTQARGAMDKVLAKLFAEIARSLGFYRSQYPNAVVSDIYLCGGSALLQGLEQSVKERFNLSVKRSDNIAAFKVAGSVDAAELQRSKIFLGGAMGLALRGLTRCRMQIDLMPQDVRRAQNLKKRVAFVAGAYLILALAGILFWAFSTRLAQIQDMRTAVLDVTYHELETLSRKVGQEQGHLALLQRQFQGVEEQLVAAQMWPAVLHAVSQALPRNFWLVRIAGDRAAPGQWGKLVLEGKTSGDIDQDLPRFREELAKIPLFTNVEIASAQVQKGIVEFTVTLKVKAVGLSRDPQAGKAL